MTPEKIKAAASVTVWGHLPNHASELRLFTRAEIEARLVALLERLDRKGLIDAQEEGTLPDSQTH